MRKLSELIAPSFYDVHKAIKEKKYTHYWLSGGRGSTKSSFISLQIVLGIMSDPKANATIFRKVRDTIRKSVYEQMLWAIEALGVKDYWATSISPMECVYLPTGQRIVFKGCDNANKVKASTFSKGYNKYIWFEELDDFESVAEIRKVNQTLVRGGKEFVIFYSYNPPISTNNWCNNEAMYNRKDRLVHHSTYLDVPEEWLGKPFLIEAAELKKQDLRAYEHEYLGLAVGSGGEIFRNIKLEEIPQGFIDNFEYVHRGCDFGYAVDPFCYVELVYDIKKKEIYIFNEIYGVGMTNADSIQRIKLMNPDRGTITADCAEPKTIQEYRNYGLRMRACKKGKDSINNGIKWLQGLNKIVIDEVKCPNVAREFLAYEMELDNQGNWKSEYPSTNNHSIDSVRYACNDEIMRFKERRKDKAYERRILNSQQYQHGIDELVSEQAPQDFFNW